MSFQEPAARISHRNTAAVCDAPVADRMLQRVALDENLHMIFYRAICGAALDLVPDQAIEAVGLIVENFHFRSRGEQARDRLATYLHGLECTRVPGSRNTATAPWPARPLG